MSKSEKIKIMIIISLVTSFLSVAINFLSSYIFEKWIYVSIVMAIVSVILMYIIGVFIGYKKGIKNYSSITYLGLMILIFDLIFGFIIFPILLYLFNLENSWAEGLYYSVIYFLFLEASGYLAIFHIVSILILLLIKKIGVKSK